MVTKPRQLFSCVLAVEYAEDKMIYSCACRGKIADYVI
jgi:hypothetical protein